MGDQECFISPFYECNFGRDEIREGIIIQVFTRGGIPVTHIMGETSDLSIKHLVVVDLGDGSSTYEYAREYYPWDGREGDYSGEAQWVGLPEGTIDPCEIFGDTIESVALEGHFEPIPDLGNIALSLTAINQGF